MLDHTSPDQFSPHWIVGGTTEHFKNGSIFRDSLGLLVGGQLFLCLQSGLFHVEMLEIVVQILVKQRELSLYLSIDDRLGVGGSYDVLGCCHALSPHDVFEDGSESNEAMGKVRK